MSVKWIRLQATSVREARAEAKQYAPCSLTGYIDGDAVYISCIRAIGNKAPVATAIRNRSPKPNVFHVEKK